MADLMRHIVISALVDVTAACGDLGAEKHSDQNVTSCHTDRKRSSVSLMRRRSSTYYCLPDRPHSFCGGPFGRVAIAGAALKGEGGNGRLTQSREVPGW